MAEVRDYPQQVLAEVRESVVKELETLSSTDPAVPDLLAELRVMRKVKRRLAAISEQAKQAFGIKEDIDE